MYWTDVQLRRLEQRRWEELVAGVVSHCTEEHAIRGEHTRLLVAVGRDASNSETRQTLKAVQLRSEVGVGRPDWNS